MRVFILNRNSHLLTKSYSSLQLYFWDFFLPIMEVKLNIHFVICIIYITCYYICNIPYPIVRFRFNCPFRTGYFTIMKVEFASLRTSWTFTLVCVGLRPHKYMTTLPMSAISSPTLSQLSVFPEALLNIIKTRMPACGQLMHYYQVRQRILPGL